jgi:hypothetical protein
VRHEVAVRIASARTVEEVWADASDVDAWPSMPGAELSIASSVEAAQNTVQYEIVSGLPVLEHEGRVVIAPSGSGGAEIVIEESFRARIWGTGGYLRGRRERTLVDLARAWAERPDGS